MGKDADEIQKKLVELEISIKDEEAKNNLPASKAKSTGLTNTNTDTSLTVGNQDQAGDAGMYQVGGVVCLIVSVGMLLAHMRIGTAFAGLWGFGPTLGLMVVPLLVGIGMLFYDYKSRLAQVITVGSLALIMFVMLSSMSIVFPMLSMLDFVTMAIPLCLGGAFLMKAHVKRRQVGEIKDNKR